MAWRGSTARSLLAAARSSSSRPPAVSPSLRRAPAAGPRLPHRRASFASPRYLGALGCAQSFLPLYSVLAAPCLTSHLSASARACCELSQVLVDGRKLPLRFDRGKWKRWLMQETGFDQWESMCMTTYLKRLGFISPINGGFGV